MNKKTALFIDNGNGYERLYTEQEVINDLQQRIDKAIEYIENENIIREQLPKHARIEVNNFDKMYRKDLLKILKGDE